MLRHRPSPIGKAALSVLTLTLTALPAWAQTGYILTGTGPVNRSMGGAAVGAPLDGPGAIYWNSATISALPNSMDFGVELLWPQTSLASTYSVGSLAPGVPGTTMSGADRGDNGIFALPTMALVYRPDCSPFTFGLGVFAIGGFGVNYPSSTTNPILTPQAPLGVGVGSVYSDLQLIQLAPTVSYQVTERLSIGIGPTMTLGNLRVDPLFVGPRNDANGDGISTIPPGAHSRLIWGGGFQVGAFYKLDGGWNLGASFKSPQWLEDTHFQSTDELGRPVNSTFHYDVPMIISVGVGYTGFEKWTLAADVRWIDYDGANGTRRDGYSADGALQGVGWRSIFALALGAQYKLTDNISTRVGYSFNDNPIDNSLTGINIASPVIIQHTVYVGASYNVSSALKLSMAYAHLFQNGIDGPVLTPQGAIAGTSLRSVSSADTFLLGATVYFGAKN